MKINVSILAFISVIALTSTSLADVNSNRSLYSVNGFYKSTELVADSLKQEATKKNFSCGPTSLLFLYNYFHYKENNEIPSFLTDVTSSGSALGRLYTFLNRSDNSITEFDELKSIAKSRWNWKDVKRASSSNSKIENIAGMIRSFKENKPILVIFNKRYEASPVSGYAHIVIAYAYQRKKGSQGLAAMDANNDHQNDRIYYYDPYFGKNDYFKRSEIGTNSNNGVIDLGCGLNSANT